MVTWGGRGSGGAAARAAPLLPPAPAHRTAPRRGSPCSRTRSCTRPHGGPCSGWGPRPSRGTLLPAETARWPGAGRPRCSSAQRPLRARHPGTFGHRAKRLCREGARNPRRTAPGGPCQGPGGHVWPWRGCQDGVPGCARGQASPMQVPPWGGPEPSATREGLRPRPPSLHPAWAGLGSLPQRGCPQDPEGSLSIPTAGRPGPTSLLPCRPSGRAPGRSCFRSQARRLTQEHDHRGQEVAAQQHGQARGREAWVLRALASLVGTLPGLCSDRGPGSAPVSAPLAPPCADRMITWL